MRRTSRLAVLVALLGVLVAAGGCRAWESYVPITPQSDGWTHEPGDLPEEYVWRADGVTVRVYAEGRPGGIACVGNSEIVPRDVTLTCVVTNDGPGPLAVTVECGGAGPGATYEGVWTSPSEAAIPLFPKRNAIDFLNEAFVLPERGPDGEPAWQDFDLISRRPKNSKSTTQCPLVFDLYLRRGDVEIHCPAHFVAHGSGRDFHWYTIPADAAMWTVEICAIVVLWPLAFHGAG